MTKQQRPSPLTQRQRDAAPPPPLTEAEVTASRVTEADLARWQLTAADVKSPMRARRPGRR
jgi:hypothetical protein